MKFIQEVRALVGRAARGTDGLTTMEFGEKVARAAYRWGFRRGQATPPKTREAVEHLRCSQRTSEMSRADLIRHAKEEDAGWTRTECGKKIRSDGPGWAWEVRYMDGKTPCRRCVTARKKREL
jgi:hypothetical protein